MGMMAMTVALIFLTLGAGCLLWTLLLHFEEVHGASEHEASQPNRAVLLFLTVAALIIAGTLAALLLEAQQLFMST